MEQLRRVFTFALRVVVELTREAITAIFDFFHDNNPEALLTILINLPWATYIVKAKSTCDYIVDVVSETATAASDAFITFPWGEYLTSAKSVLQVVWTYGNHVFQMVAIVMSAAKEAVAESLNPMVAEAVMILLYAIALMMLVRIPRALLKWLLIISYVTYIILEWPVRWHFS